MRILKHTWLPEHRNCLFKKHRWYPDAQKVLINKENVIFKKKTNNNKILHPDFKHFFKIQV